MKGKARRILGALVAVLILLSACAPASTQKSVEGQRSQPAAPPTAGGATNQATFDSAGQKSPGQSNQAFGPADRLVIYTANLTLFVKDLGQSMDAVTEIVNVAGGFVAGTRIDGDATPKDKDGVQTAYVTLRIPATKYQDVLARLRKLSVKSPQEDSTSQDVTEEYSDLQAQLRNLEVVEAQYQELMKKATTIDEILKVQQKLGETRSLIERTKGRIVYLERRADMATVNVYLKPEALGKDGRPQIWDPLKEAADAWNASLVFLQAIATVAIKITVFFWWMLPPVLLAAILWQLWRTKRRPAVTPGA